MSTSKFIDTSPILSMVRTIHPVGQGGFYTEIFRDPNDVSVKEKCFVYDCGSSTFRGKKLESIIISSIPNNLDIEALFISHFDADHINGIEILAKERKIKCIVMPQIDKLGWFYVLVNCFETEKKQYDADIVERIRKICKKHDIRLIQVEPFKRDGYRDGDNSQAIDISKITEDTQIRNGQKLIFYLSIDSVWEYIPINTSDLAKIDLLKSKLNSFLTGKFKDSIDSISTEEVIKLVSFFRSDINKIYKSVFGTSNNSSMCLYSGSLKRETAAFFCHNPENSQCLYLNRHYFFPLNRPCNRVACLYTGDANLIDNELVRRLQNVLNQRLDMIGLVQIPHHGSICNSNDVVFSKLVDGKHIVLFVSFGKNNIYGHPSHYLIESLLISEMYVFQVTEDQDSAVYQKIIITK